MKEEPRSSDPAATRRREQDLEVEELTKRIAEVVNSAGIDNRQDLREYAIGLLKEETEFADIPPAATASKEVRSSSQSVGIAVLLAVVSLPLLLLFPPVGVVLLFFAVVMGVWGVVAGAFGH